ncbi:MAG: TonB-dependent receptor [Chitinophagaceae bacterium]
MKRKYLPVAVSAMLAANMQQSYAQQIQGKVSTDSIRTYHHLNGVVVTGQYKPVQAENAVQRIRVIDQQKIAAMGAQNLRDVLTNEMNVTIAQDNVLGSSVQMQGISGQNVKILVDGVPVIGRQNGNIDISQLNVYNVERIEIIEGPMSVNYGTDALAGTINIITKSSLSSGIEAGVNTYTESIGKYNINGRVGVNRGRHSFVLSGARNFFDGWDPKEGWDYADFKAKMPDSNRARQWDPKEEYNLNFNYCYRLKHIQLRYKGDYFQDLITNRGNPEGFYGYTAFDDYYRTCRFNNAILVNGTAGKGYNISFLAAYNSYQRKMNRYSRDLTTGSDQPGSPSDQDTSDYALFNSRATIGKSASGKKLAYEAGYDINVEKGTGKRIAGGVKNISDYAAYGSAEYRPTDSLILRGGLRYAYNTAFRAPLIPSLNIKYTPHKGLDIRAAYSRGFRAPGVKELFFEFNDSNHDIIGNDKLKPEQSNNLNASVSFRKEIRQVHLSIEVASFYNSISDMISLALTDSARNQYSYINIDHYKAKGIQTNVSLGYKHLLATFGASYIGRFNQLSGGDETSIPKFSYTPEARLNLSYQVPVWHFTASLFGKYTGKNPGYALDTAGNAVMTTIAAYTIADISFTKTCAQNRISISFGCKNLFNTGNVNRLNANVSSGSAHSSSGPLSIATGRSLFIGLGYTFTHANTKNHDQQQH